MYSDQPLVGSLYTGISYHHKGVGTILQKKLLQIKKLLKIRLIMPNEMSLSSKELDFFNPTPRQNNTNVTCSSKTVRTGKGEREREGATLV